MRAPFKEPLTENMISSSYTVRVELESISIQMGHLIIVEPNLHTLNNLES